jgi:hypothetical protein
VYDQDAKDNLDNGETPACHVMVGADAIFVHAPFEPEPQNRCVGHDAWCDGKPGFAEPRLQS